jgi:prophage regulatory protein
MPTEILRLPEVLRLTGYTKASIYRLVSLGRFPKPVHLCGGRAAGWVKSEVLAVIETAIAERDQTKEVA